MRIKTLSNNISRIGFCGLVWLAFVPIAWGQESFKIGVPSPYSGDLASYGIPAKNAAILAAKEINAKGGVLGKPLELLIEDDVCEPNTATGVANKLVSAGVVAVMGHLCSAATESALVIYKNAKVLVISPASTNPALTLKDKFPNFFRTIAHDASQADLQSNYALSSLKVKKAAVVHDKGTYGKSLADIVRINLEKGNVEVALYEGITPGAVDYSALIRKIQQSGVDAVFFGGYHPEASKIISQARQKNLTMNFISGDGVKDPSFLKIAAKNAEGYYVSAPIDLTQLPMAKLVTQKYKAEYNLDPGTFSYQAYTAIQAIAGAIETAGGTEIDKLVDALHKNEVDSPLGKISFDKHGDIIGAGFAMYQVKNGTFERAK